MRASVLTGLAFSILALCLGSHAASAGSDQQEISISKSGDASPVNAGTEKYRGYFLDLSQIAGQQNYSEIINSLHRQLDIVESVGLSPRVLNFFHTIPIVIDEAACSDGMKEDKSPVFAAACYGPAEPVSLQNRSTHGSYWDSEKAEWVNSDPIALAEDTHLGVVMVRNRYLNPQSPVLLHEMLHAYHTNLMAGGFDNQVIKSFYDDAKGKNLYPADAYLMTNHKEFFAVTASIFLYGKDDKEPFMRSKIKEKQPEYYKYLTWLFEVNPEHGTPIASAD
jgi:hypothetical protein